MTAFDLCALTESVLFKVGNSKIVWEAAHYSDRSDKVVISRIVDAEEGGKAFLLGAAYKQRYLNPDTEVTLVKK